MNAADEPLEHFVLKTKITELQEARCRTDGSVLSSMIDVVDFASGSVLAFFVSAFSSNHAFRCTAEVSELQIK